MTLEKIKILIELGEEGILDEHTLVQAIRRTVKGTPWQKEINPATIITPFSSKRKYGKGKLSEKQWRVFDAIKTSNKPLSAFDLKKLGMSMGAMTGTLTLLFKRKYVKREKLKVGNKRSVFFYTATAKNGNGTESKVMKHPGPQKGQRQVRVFKSGEMYKEVRELLSKGPLHPITLVEKLGEKAGFKYLTKRFKQSTRASLYRMEREGKIKNEYDDTQKKHLYHLKAS